MVIMGPSSAAPIKPLAELLTVSPPPTPPIRVSGRVPPCPCSMITIAIVHLTHEHRIVNQITVSNTQNRACVIWTTCLDLGRVIQPPWSKFSVGLPAPRGSTVWYPCSRNQKTLPLTPPPHLPGAPIDVAEERPGQGPLGLLCGMDGWQGSGADMLSDWRRTPSFCGY